MSRVKPADDCQNPEPRVKQLRHYLMAHPQPSPEHFAEMIALATKLDNDKLLHQCKVFFLIMIRSIHTRDLISML